MVDQTTVADEGRNGLETDALPARLLSASTDALTASILFCTGLVRSHHDFVVPFLTACNSFWERESVKLPKRPWIRILRITARSTGSINK